VAAAGAATSIRRQVSSLKDNRLDPGRDRALGPRNRSDNSFSEPVGRTAMKSIILWALGVPLIVIILLNIFHVL
jgi:hypothetical protein